MKYLFFLQQLPITIPDVVTKQGGNVDFIWYFGYIIAGGFSLAVGYFMKENYVKDKELKELRAEKDKELKELRAEKDKEHDELMERKDKEIRELRSEKEKEIKELSKMVTELTNKNIITMKDLLTIQGQHGNALKDVEKILVDKTNVTLSDTNTKVTDLVKQIT